MGTVFFFIFSTASTDTELEPGQGVAVLMAQVFLLKNAKCKVPEIRV